MEKEDFLLHVMRTLESHPDWLVDTLTQAISRCENE